jgi:hypothetical protein
MNVNNIDGDLEKAPESPTGSEPLQESPPDAKFVENGVTNLTVLPSVPPQEPPPDGGTMAWLQVLGSFCLWVATL